MHHEKATAPAKPSELQKQLQEKLAEIKAVEQEIPGVLIIHDVRNTTVVHMSPRGLQILGTTLEEVQELGEEYLYRYFNPEDAKDYVPKILGLVRRNRDDEIVSFFQQVRPAGTQDYSWFLSCTKVLLRDASGAPAYIITTAIPVDAQHYFSAKVERLLQENNFLRSNRKAFESLSRREKEVLRLMVLGQNSSEIASALFISEPTAKTHRRNIRRKLNAHTNYDLTRFAQAFDLI